MDLNLTKNKAVERLLGVQLKILYQAFKRFTDILIPLVLLPILVLCSLILLILNWSLNPGKLMFVQERVGQDGRIFFIYKFRTMTGSGGGIVPRFAPDEVDRITRLGAFLRASRIDELPQIINVFKGEMSMVGPRPEQVIFVSQYERSIRNYANRQVVRPGITGLAQLKYGYTLDEAGTVRKLKWDLLYIKHQGFLIDLYIIWNTFLFVLGSLLRIRMKTKL